MAPPRIPAVPAPEPNPALSDLQKWLAQIPYNSIRRVERAFDDVYRADGKMLRGLMVADNLCLTRQREFFVVGNDGKKSTATPISNEEVAQHYNIADLQNEYRDAQDRWKSTTRKRSA